jgi:uncharacterized membrane-anchored protein
MSTLIKLSEEARALEARIALLAEESGGEITEELELLIDELAVLEIQTTGKLDKYVYVMKKIESEQEMLKDRMKAVQSMMKAKENTANFMKARIMFHMQNMETTELQGELWTLKIVNSGGKLPVIYSDYVLEDLPPAYVKTVTSLDSDAVRKVLDSNVELDFASYGERGKSLRIS